MTRSRSCILFLVAALLMLVFTTSCSPSGETNLPDVGGETQSCDVPDDCVPENGCQVAACEDGICVFTDAPDDGPCDDGDFCTSDDHCSGGSCSGSPVICDDGQHCNGLELCDPASGDCQEGTAPDLDDDNPCTVDECDEAEDKVVNLPDDLLCDDDDPCTIDTCGTATGCTYEAFTGACDDADPCTVDDSCAKGSCAGAPKDCGDGSFCNGAEECDPETGDCLEGLPPEIDDGVECTADACDEENDEVVNDPDDLACDDENPCTLDVCDVDEGCQYENATTECDDEDPCTSDDMCAEGVCVPGEWTCFEDCANGEDDDTDELIDCDDPDCSWELNCLDSGETCASAYVLNQGVALVLGDTVDFPASTVDKESDYAGSCSEASDESPDTVHLLEIGEPVGISVTVDFIGQAWPSLYILAQDCQAELACEAASSTDAITAVGVLMPGIYYIVVDGNFVDGAGNGDEADYDLLVETFAPALTETGCSNGIDDDADGLLDCADDDCETAPQCTSVAGETCADAKALFGGPVADTGEVIQASVESSTKGLDNDLAGSCDVDTGNAPDMVFTFTLSDALWLEASHDFDGVLYPALYLYDGDCDQGEELACVKAFEGAAELSMPVAAGTYYLVVDGSYGKDAGSFTLNVSLSPLADEESDCANGQDDDMDGDLDCDDDDCAADVYCVGFPGDNCQQALPINDGKPIAEADAGLSLVYNNTTLGLLDHYGADCDADTSGTPDLVYFMNLATPMTLNLSHDFEGTLWPALYVLGDNCAAGPVFGCATGFSGAASLSLTLPSGKFYVVVDGAFLGDAGPFTLTVDFSQAPQFEVNCTDGMDEDMDGFIDCEDTDCEFELYCSDPYEPNDDLAEAAVLGELEVVGPVLEPGTMIYPAADEDWFELVAPSPGFLHVQALPDDDLDLKLLLFDGDGIALDEADEGYSGEDEALVYSLKEAGTVLLAVDGFQESTGSYELLFALQPPTETELNCTDGMDNDLDNSVDCADDDCGSSPFCGAGDDCDNAVDVNGGEPVGAAFDGVQLDLSGSTVGYGNDLAGSCSAPSGEAADSVWKLVLSDPMVVNVVLDFEGYKYPSFYVLEDGCDGAEMACAAGDKEPLPAEFQLEPGTWFLVVDGNWAGDESPYSLSLLFTLVQTEETNCVDGEDDDNDNLIDCDDPDCALDDACRGLTCDFPFLVNEGNSIGEDDDGLALSYEGTTVGFTNDFSGDCSEASLLAPDVVYSFVLAESMNVTVSHAFEGNFWPAVYVIAGDCGEGEQVLCAVNTTEAALATGLLDPGTYFVIVDGDFDGDEAPYFLDLLFTAPLATELICDDGIDDDGDDLTDCNDDDCALDAVCVAESCLVPALINEGNPIVAADDGTSLVYEGDTTGMQGNLSGSCDVDTGAAADAVYALEIGDPMVVTITHAFGGFFYPAVYVLAGDCSTEAEVACAAETDAPAVIEELVLQPGTYYVVVDASFAEDEAPYTLTLLFAAVPETEISCGDGKDNDADSLTDCCDEDCLLDPVCVEGHCGDGLDADCDLSVDCDDSECVDSAFCVEQTLPYSEGFEYEGSWPDGWAVDGPNDACGWAVDAQGADSLYSMQFAYGSCSEVESYILASPWLALAECNEITLSFTEQGAFTTWMVYHAAGFDDGVTPAPVETEAPGEDFGAPVSLVFDVTGVELGRVYFGYQGDNADDWWVDNVLVTCTAFID
jgi:hypothetical protein